MACKPRPRYLILDADGCSLSHYLLPPTYFVHRNSQGDPVHYFQEELEGAQDALERCGTPRSKQRVAEVGGER